MDYRVEVPEKQKGKTLYSAGISAFGFSLQGASHANKQPPVPCQDYNDFDYLEEEDILIAAIADGVGSCTLSHWGAYTAVRSALDSVKKGLRSHGTRKKLILDASKNEEMKDILYDAFCVARDAVERFADEAGELPYNFQSTLTLAVYDGENLLYGHVGDDGIVVQTTDGSVELLTARQKGEEASSVFPLQSGERAWHFGRAAKPVAAFVMATDGVLDAFVTNRPDYFEVNYCKGVCYAFMEEAVYTLGSDSQEAPHKAMDHYTEYLNSADYRAQVTDDLTMIAVVSRPQLAASKHPKFSMEIWNTIQKESNAARRLLLSHKPLPRTTPGDIAPNRQDEQKYGEKEMPEPAEPLRKENKQGQAMASEENASFGRRPWISTLLILLLTAAALTGGFAAGRWLFPEITREAFHEVSQKRDEISQEAESLTAENQRLEEASHALSEELEQVSEERAAANVQLEKLEREAEALQKQVKDLQGQLEALQNEPTE